MEVMKRVFFTSLFLAVLCAVVSGQAFPGRGQTCTKPPPRCPRTWNYATNSIWGAACPAWSQCNQLCGTNQQSPINIVTPVLRNGARDSPLNIRYKSLQNLTIFNTGNFYTFGVDKRSGLTFDFNGFEYYLRKVEFHSPSEHMLNGRQFDMEVQFIHDSGVFNAPTLISSVFFQRNSRTGANQFLESIIYSLPEFSDCTCGNGRVDNPPAGSVNTVGISEQCDEGNRNSNTSSSKYCCRLDCTRPYCGDGIIDQGEACDDGAANSDTKANACRKTWNGGCCKPTCGDGVLDSGEDCDDGNRQNLDGCSSICKFECGDGELNLKNGLEQCDDGANNSDSRPNACRVTNCRLPFCGDGVIDSVRNETCDNGANNFGYAPSQCRPGCIAPRCGDGLTDLNEQCDPGDSNLGPNSYCSSNCTLNCNNALANGAKVCDNTIGGGFNSDNSSTYDQGCRTICVRPMCGDGVIDDGECCDSVYIDGTGTVIGNRWCNSNCQQVCGNGLPDAGEQCDHGCYNADLPNRCRTDCTKPRCGDGIPDAGEMCDTGSLSLGPNLCRPGCVLPKCGDGVVDNLFGETCDDGNNNPGDGCDPSCRKECGNGNLEVNTTIVPAYIEECDLGLGNANVANTCRTNCRLPFCGDGILDTLEECDNGNSNSDTAPNACRTNCRFPYCGDGIIDTANGEKCDEGANNNDVTVNGCSTFCIPNFCRQKLVKQVDFRSALPVNQTAFVYDGSWSYPPCSTGVKWLVFSEVQPMTDRQLQALTTQNKMPENARSCQNDCGRSISRPQLPAAPICGNGILENYGLAPEKCDMGWYNNDYQANSCRTNCQLPRCGDGVTDAGEECDDPPYAQTKYALGNATWPFGRCNADCTLVKIRQNPFVSAPWGYSATCRWAFTTPTCGGNNQSPVDISSTARCAAGGGLVYNYQATTFNVVNSGKGISVLLSAAGTFTDPSGKVYTIKRIDFHSPSEHTFFGKHADLEAQLIHQAADGSMAAVSILFNQGVTKSRLVDQVSFYFPRERCQYGNGIVDPNEQCDDGANNSDFRPDACRRNGMLPSCGDGVVDRGEECDYGRRNALAANSCKPGSCRLPFCGDGFLDIGEQCDFGIVGGPNCTKQCQLRCGNGILEFPEQCDNGTLNSNIVPDACRLGCTFATCGDNVIDSGEDCDDGMVDNLSNRTGCRVNCKRGTCGDGFVDSVFGEQCDLGSALNGVNSNCSSTCQRNCGNGVLNAGEQCDNGAMNGATDGACRITCMNATCGDGILDVSLGEECDIGPSTVTSTICRNCKLTCGNGIVEPQFGEQCDDGTLNDDTIPNACRTTCQNHFCGDGVRDADEACDFGSQNTNAAANPALNFTSPCRVACVLPKCSDGYLDLGEDCDDGNLLNGDGCSSTCKKECGNGRRDSVAEECDDGLLNGNIADACRLNCKLPRCGDGVRDSGEQCDDGNNGNGDSQCRAGCTLPYCGDGFVDSKYGEQCDNGAANDDLAFGPGACSSTCTLNDCNTCSSGSALVNVAGSFDATSPVFSYSGSRTTPPCTEGVQWYVLQNIHTLTPAQFAVFQSRIYSPNARGVQPLNGRAVSCLLQPAVCGNCVLEAGEECDAGDNNANVADKCRVNCKKPVCGDGIVDSGEECDNGTNNNGLGPCGLNCRLVRGCPVTCTGSSCPSCSASAPVTNTCPGTCPGTCPASSTTNSGTIININFANLLRGAGCGSGNGSCGCGN